MATVYLGCRLAFNDDGRQPETGAPIPTDQRATLDGKRRTEVTIPPGQPFAQMLRTITDPGGVWAAQSPLEAPAWVASNDPDLAAALGRHYGCEVREFLPRGERGEFPAREGAGGGED